MAARSKRARTPFMTQPYLEFPMNRIAILLAVLAASNLVQAADTPASAATPGTPQAWAEKMLDPTQNASAFKDPAAFQQWSAAMMNPATSMALMQQGMDPNTVIRMLSGLMNPASMQNAMQFSDPNIAIKWMAAGIDPRFAANLLSQGLNPNAYLNMMQAPLSPQMLGMGAQMLNPGMYGNWLAAPTQPAALNAMMAPMNPGMYMNWMGAGMNPNTYGPWGQMLGMPGAPAATVPFIDPALLMKMLQTLPAPAQAPQ